MRWKPKIKKRLSRFKKQDVKLKKNRKEKDKAKNGTLYRQIWSGIVIDVPHHTLEKIKHYRVCGYRYERNNSNYILIAKEVPKAEWDDALHRSSLMVDKIGYQVKVASTSLKLHTDLNEDDITLVSISGGLKRLKDYVKRPYIGC